MSSPSILSRKLVGEPMKFSLYLYFVWNKFLFKAAAEKGRLVTYLIVLPHMPTWFMTSLIQTPRYIMVALTINGSRDSQKSIFNKQDEKSSKRAAVYIIYNNIIIYNAVLTLLTPYNTIYNAVLTYNM